MGTESISIKIRFHQKSGEPMLYDSTDMPIGFFKGNFSL